MFRGLLVLLLIMALETIHGIMRGLFLAPRFGDKLSSQLGWPVAAMLVFAVTYLLIGWTRVTGTAALRRLGAAWAVLTFLFECGISLLRGLDGPRIWAEINPHDGGLMLYSLAVIFVSPLVADRLRT